MATILEVDPRHPQTRHIQRAVQALRDGAVIAYPTDTSYGLGCDLLNKNALERIYQIKQLPKGHQLSFICPNMSRLADYVVIENDAFRAMKRLLPGPYTFILQATKEVPKFMAPHKRRTVGIRIPDHPVPLALVESLGHPIVNTTAGVEGEEPLASAQQIDQRMGKLVDIILDTGILQFDESSVVDLSGDAPEIIREGKGDVSLFR